MNNSIKLFSKAAKVRNILKKIQQLSWTITKFEQKFPFDEVKDEEIEELITAYLSFSQENIRISDELREELQKDSYFQKVIEQEGKNEI